MRNATIATAVLALLMPAAAVRADQITLQPDPANLYNLDHYQYYTWGLSTEKDVSTIVITDAVLSFENIRNWDTNHNVLYVHLLDEAEDGVESYPDGQGGGDNFLGEGIELVTYRNLPVTGQDLDYPFTGAEITTLNEYVQNGASVGLGFDPDCHFWNDGVKLTLTYGVVPEPACASLVVLGATVVLLKRYRRR